MLKVVQHVSTRRKRRKPSNCPLPCHLPMGLLLCAGGGCCIGDGGIPYMNGCRCRGDGTHRPLWDGR